MEYTMFDVILNVIYCVKFVTSWALLLSYKIGQCVFYSLYYVLTLLTTFTTNCAKVLNVLSEDFNVFIIDLLARFMHLISGVLHILKHIVDNFLLLGTAVQFVFYLVTLIINGVNTVFQSLLSGVVYVLYSFKHFFVLLGSGLWFAITLLPNSIVYILVTIHDTVTNILKTIGAYSFEKIFAFTNWLVIFLSDIPLESVLAMVIVISITFIAIQTAFPFRRYTQNLYTSIIRAITKMFTNTKILLTRSFRRKKNIIENKTDEDKKEKTYDRDDLVRYCVVCQEREKCVLLLPCKHVCLCIECNNTYCTYNTGCPICRSFVQKRMKIFI